MSESLKDLSLFSFYEITSRRCGWGCSSRRNATQSVSNAVLDLFPTGQHKRELTTTLLTTHYTNTTQHNITLE